MEAEAPTRLGRPVDVEQQVPKTEAPEQPEVRLAACDVLGFVTRVYGIMILMQLLTLGSLLSWQALAALAVHQSWILTISLGLLGGGIIMLQFSSATSCMWWYRRMLNRVPWNFVYLTMSSLCLGSTPQFMGPLSLIICTFSRREGMMELCVLSGQLLLTICLASHTVLTKAAHSDCAFTIATLLPLLLAIGFVSAEPSLWWAFLICGGVVGLWGVAMVYEIRQLFDSLHSRGERDHGSIENLMDTPAFLAWKLQLNFIWIQCYLPFAAVCSLLCCPALAALGLYRLAGAEDPESERERAAVSLRGQWVVDLPCGKQATATVASGRFECAGQECELKEGPPTHFEWPGGVCQELMSVDHNGGVLLWRTRSRWPQTLRWTRVPSCPRAVDGHTMQVLSSQEAYVCGQCGKEHSAAAPSVRWHSRSHGASLCPECHPCPKPAVLGVSTEWILGTFPELARSATGKANPNFHEICPAVAMGPQGLGFGKICPRDGGLGCSILDALDESCRGRATHFVSWCWDYTLEDFVSAIQSWIQREATSPSDVCLWVCFFCNNQYRMIESGTQTGSDELKAVFENHLDEAGRMLLMLDSFTTPKYVTRAWCIFESYVCINRNLDMSIILPFRSRESFRETLDAAGGLSQLRKAFEDMDMRYAEASNKVDEDMIKKLILTTSGFDAVNDAVQKCLLKWLTSMFQEDLLSQRR